MDRATYAVQSPLTGDVASESLAIGRQVKRGDVLVELDSTAEKLQMEEECSRLAAGELEISALAEQIAVEEQARQDEQRTAQGAIEVAQSRVRETAVLADHAALDLVRLGKLWDLKLIAERYYNDGQSEVRRQRAAVESAASEVQRLQEDRQARDSERVTRIRKLSTDMSLLRGQQEVVRSTIGRLEYEIERRKVRAATGGRIGEAAIVRAGGVVTGGERLAAIIPEEAC